MRSIAQKSQIIPSLLYISMYSVESHKRSVRQMLNVSSVIEYEYDIGSKFRGYAALLTNE